MAGSGFVLLGFTCSSGFGSKLMADPESIDFDHKENFFPVQFHERGRSGYRFNHVEAINKIDQVKRIEMLVIEELRKGSKLIER